PLHRKPRTTYRSISADGPHIAKLGWAGKSRNTKIPSNSNQRRWPLEALLCALGLLPSEFLHRFYHESSVLSRPEPDGKALKTVTTLQILSADYQFSLNGGVIILVTGHLTGKDNVQRKFTQTFFLAPQDTGFFVLNDIFKYVDGVVENIVVDQSTPEASLAPNHEPSAVADQPELNQTTSVEVNNTNGKELNNTHGKESINVLENGQETVTENSVVAENPVESSQNVAPQVTEAAASNTQKDAPKKSFASVVNALNGNNAPFLMRTRPTKPVERPREPVTPEAFSPQNNSAPEKNNVPAGKSYAIFVAKLPMNATVEELEKVFKQFGPIKRDGIQVRSNKQQGTCFGFVEFESAKAMQTALEASVKYGNFELRVEERRGKLK
ncbi:Nuclear transport factor 2 family protein with RNA binding domain, RRM-RBD-RNP motifs, partial [Prunus dulcis]